MPSPSSSLATLRPDLATFSEFDLEMSRRGFVASQILPVFDVASQSGSFGKIPVEQLLQNRETKRAPGSGYSRGKWTFTSATYACEEHGAEEPIDDREAAMYANYFSAEQVSTMRAYESVLKNQEQRVADLLFNATTWNGAALTTGITHEWDDATNAVPITDIEAAARKVWTGCGMWPNALILNRNVFRNLRNVDQVVNRAKYQGFMDVRPGSITAQQLAVVFDLDMIIVAGAVKNSANEGQSVSFANIWSDEYAMLARVCTSQDMREPGLGRIFHWGQDGSQPGGTVETYRDETIRGDVVRVRHDVDEVVLYTEAAHLLSNVTTI